MMVIPHLPGRHLTHPGGVSAKGLTIAGTGFVDRDHAAAFIWDAAHGMRILQTVLESDYDLDLAGWNLETAAGITPDGSVIAGWGRNPEGHREGLRVILGSRSSAPLSVGCSS